MQIVYIPETTLNSTPGTPVGITLRCTDFDSNISVPNTDSKEIRDDRQESPGSQGAAEASPTAKGELSYGTLDDFIAAALGSTWSPSLASVNLAVDGTNKTITRASGDNVADGFVVGQTITPGGFTNGGNNLPQALTAVTTTVLTFGGAVGMVTEASAAGRTLTGNIVKVGASRTPKSVTLEHKDVSTTDTKFEPMTGVVVNKLGLSGALKENVEYSLDLLAMTVLANGAATLFTSITPANTNPVFGNAIGSIKMNNVAMPNVTKWSMEVDNSAEVGRVCFNPSAHNAAQQVAKITGTLDVYFADHTQSDRYRNGTEFPLLITIGDGLTKSLILDLGRVKITDRKAPEKDGVRNETITWKAYVPLTGTNTACMATRKP